MNLNFRQFTIMGLVFMFLVGLPVILFLNQNKQDTRSKASSSSRLYFVPTSSSANPIQKNTGESVTFDVMIDPGTNMPSVVKLEMVYDPTKLQANGPAAFTPNTAAFPTTLEGPFLTQNSVAVSVSIGSDTTRAIQQITKVGTLTLTTLAPTTTNPTVISFGTRSQILSVGPNDQANENVLSTTQPAIVAIAPAPTATPAPVSPSVTLTPTLFIEPTLTLAPTLPPTGAPTTLAPTTAAKTTLSFTLYMHGIGNSGDNVNPNAHTLSNKNPLHPTRVLTVQVYDAFNQLVTTTTGNINYDSANGYFTGLIDLGNTIVSGQYTVKVQALSHLRRLIPGIQTLVPQQNNIMPTATFIAGDINGDNVLNIVDYNLIVGCYSDLLPPISCDTNTKLLTDLNDDDAVNQFDYNLFLREITVQAGS